MWAILGIKRVSYQQVPLFVGLTLPALVTTCKGECSVTLHRVNRLYSLCETETELCLRSWMGSRDGTHLALTAFSNQTPFPTTETTGLSTKHHSRILMQTAQEGRVNKTSRSVSLCGDETINETSSVNSHCGFTCMLCYYVLNLEKEDVFSSWVTSPDN